MNADRSRTVTNGQSAWAYAALTTAGVLWGTTVPLSKLALDWLPPAWLTFGRFGIAAVLLMPAARGTLRRACTPAVLASGALGYGASVIVQNAGIARTSVSHASLLVGAVPVLVAVISAVWHRAVARPLAWMGFAISLAGIGLITGTRGGGATLAGDGLVLASAVLSATAMVAQGRMLRDHDPVAMTAAQFLGAALAALPAALTEGIPPAPTGPGAILAVVALAAAGTLVPFTLYAYGQTRMPAAVAGAFVNLEPLVGTLAGIVFFANPAGLAQLAGGAAILSGIALSSYRGRAVRLRADRSVATGDGRAVEECADASALAAQEASGTRRVIRWTCRQPPTGRAGPWRPEWREVTVVAVRMLTDVGDRADPVLLEIVAGGLASIEKEVETAIGRTARSPMIRDAHDFRAGIHDRLLRKLTGRSYSSLVHPIVRDFPADTMRPGDVFFHNDVYSSEGGIGHLPDLCVTVPVFHDAQDGAGQRVVAFVQAFGHHDDIGGAVPGSMPSHATSVFEEGLMVPPIRLRDAGVPNEAVLTIMTRNSRMPESLAADLDAECAACLMGARRLADLFGRYGQDAVEACFDAIVARTTVTFRREILAKIPAGTWTWEDYAEHDGVDPPRLHAQRITLTRTGDDEPGGPRLIMDFNGTSAQAKGPINHCGDYADGNFLAKWLAPVLRNLADSPERMAELDVNEGVVDLIEMRFPPPGTLLTPVFPAPTNARTFVILRLLGVFAGVLAKAVGGRMPADQETIRYTGVYGLDAAGEPYLMREVLGGGSGGRYYADGEDTIHVVPDSRNLPAEFSEGRFPLVVERLGLAVDSGGPGKFRGGLGYEKVIRMRTDGYFMSIADRSILSCWGVCGGRAGRPFEVMIDPGGPAQRLADALADGEFVPAGTLIRIRTTGGGGWGDPLDRDVALIVRDVAQGKVSRAGAAADYGVLITGHDDAPAADTEGTISLRLNMRRERPDGQPFFDRGPGYAQLAGVAAADVDWL